MYDQGINTNLEYEAFKLNFIRTEVCKIVIIRKLEEQ